MQLKLFYENKILDVSDIVNYDYDFLVSGDEFYAAEYKKEPKESDKFLTDLNRIGTFVPLTQTKLTVNWGIAPFKFRGVRFEKLTDQNNVEYTGNEFNVKYGWTYRLKMHVFCDGLLTDNIQKAKDSIVFNNENNYICTYNAYITADNTFLYNLRFKKTGTFFVKLVNAHTSNILCFNVTI